MSEDGLNRGFVGGFIEDASSFLGNVVDWGQLFSRRRNQQDGAAAVSSEGFLQGLKDIAGWNNWIGGLGYGLGRILSFFSPDMGERLMQWGKSTISENRVLPEELHTSSDVVEAHRRTTEGAAFSPETTPIERHSTLYRGWANTASIVNESTQVASGLVGSVLGGAVDVGAWAIGAETGYSSYLAENFRWANRGIVETVTGMDEQYRHGFWKNAEAPAP